MSSEITKVLEEEMYKFYLKEHPLMVGGIKKLLVAGEKIGKIKKWLFQYNTGSTYF